MAEDVAARNKQFIRDHFADLIDGKDLGALHRNLAPDFYDHNGPGGKTDLASQEPLIAGLHKMLPDITVEVRDIVAEGDLVMVRNVWSGTDAKTGKRIEAHGFVQWRLKDGKIVERWATVSPLKPLETPTFEW